VTNTKAFPGSMRIIILFALSTSLIVMSSCKPRSTRSKSKTAAKPAATAGTATPSATISARQVMSRADSAIQRVGMMRDDVEMPPMGYDPMLGPPRAPWGAPYVPRPNPTEYSRFEAGLAAFSASRYDEAIGQFSQIAVGGRPPELVPNAYYWIGESYYAMGRYSESQPYFEYVTKVGPQYKREISFFKLSRGNLHMGNKQAGEMWYQRLMAEYPSSKYGSRLRAAGAR
jgi:TolA-binding protein